MAKRSSKVISSKSKTAPVTDRKELEICFVIMPFGGWFDSYFENIYFPAIKNCGLIPRRADDLFRASSIVQDIWELTKKAKIILADLTSQNANVFYELGLAHALAKPAILITETIDDIPFDLRSLRIIDYNKNIPNWGSVLQERIENAIRATIESPNETIPTAFLETNRSNIHTTELSKQEKDLLELKQDMELLKRQVATSSQVNNEPSYTTSGQIQIARRLIGGFLQQGLKTKEEIQGRLSESSPLPENVLHALVDFELSRFALKSGQ